MKQRDSLPRVARRIHFEEGVEHLTVDIRVAQKSSHSVGVPSGSREPKSHDEGLTTSAKIPVCRNFSNLGEHGIVFLEPRILNECASNAFADWPCGTFKRIPLRCAREFF